jgi:hypothetical protein
MQELLVDFITSLDGYGAKEPCLTDEIRASVRS